MRIEEDRLQSEMARNRAERRKLLLEALETRQRLRRRWYQRKYLFESVIAGLVAAGLLVAWYVEYFSPILRSEVKLQSIKNEVAELRNAELSNENKELKRRLESDIIDFVLNSQEFVRTLEELERRGAFSSQGREQANDLLEMLKESNDRAERWQDDDSLFVGARGRLVSLAAEISEFELDEETTGRLMLNDFQGDDERLQESRLVYLRTVLLLLRGQLDHETAVAIWLAGVDQHNRSLAFKNSDQSNVEKHIKEINDMLALLVDIVKEFPVNDITTQVLRWLDITHHNMRVMRE